MIVRTSLGRVFIKTHLHLLVFVFTLLTPVTSAGNEGGRSEYAWVDGILIHYKYWPGGEPPRGNCMLVHGFSASSWSWKEVGDSLHKKGYQVIAVDLPPFGFSDKSARLNQSVTARALLLEDFLRQEFPAKSWHLAGHSMGGSVVQAMALMSPEKYNSVNFVAAALFMEINQGERSVRWLLKVPGLASFIAGVAENLLINERMVSRLLESAYGQPPTSQQVLAYLEPLKIKGTAWAILNSSNHHQEIMSLSALWLQVPAIAIWGDNDTWVPVNEYKSILAKWPEVPLHIIRGAGHIPMETHFEEFMKIWLNFMESDIITKNN